MGGLKVELQQALSSCVVNTYNEALDKALTTETNLLRVRLIRSDDKKRDSKGIGHRLGGKNSKDGEPCPRCNKVHGCTLTLQLKHDKIRYIYFFYFGERFILASVRVQL